MLVHGRGVEFEIAGVDDRAHGRCERQRSGLDDAVGEVNELHAEGAGLVRLPGLHLAQVGDVRQAVVGQLGARQRQRERRAVDGRVYFVEHVRQGADVVFVAVGEQDGPQALPVFPQVGDVGDDDVNAEQFGVREHHAAIDDHQMAIVFEGHHVHSELAEASEGNGAQLAAGGWNDRTSSCSCHPSTGGHSAWTSSRRRVDAAKHARGPGFAWR